MKKMVEMDCCDVCGKPLYAEPGYLESYPFKDSNGKEFEALFCEDCLNDKVTVCEGCGCLLKMKMLSLLMILDMTIVNSARNKPLQTNLRKLKN